MKDSLSKSYFELSKMAPGTISPIQSSYNEVTVIGIKGHRKNVSIPSEISNNPFCHIYTDYLASPNFLKLSQNTRYNRAIGIELFFKYLSKELLENTTPKKHIIMHYTQWLKENTSLSSNSIREKIHCITKPIKDLCSSPKRVEKWFWNEYFREIIAYSSSIKKGPSNPSYSLTSLFKECPYDNKEMISALRLLCCYIINTHNYQRELLLSDSRIIRLLNSAEPQKTTEPPLRYASFVKTHINASKLLYGELLTCVLDSNDILLIERFYYDFSPPKKDPPLHYQK